MLHAKHIKASLFLGITAGLSASCSSPSTQQSCPDGIEQRYVPCYAATPSQEECVQYYSTTSTCECGDGFEIREFCDDTSGVFECECAPILDSDTGTDTGVDNDGGVSEDSGEPAPFVPACIELNGLNSNDILSFGVENVEGGPYTQTFEIENCGQGGDSILTIDEFNWEPFGGGPFRVQQNAAGEPPWEIAPGETLDLTVQWTPSSAGTLDEATLVFQTNADPFERRLLASALSSPDECANAYIECALAGSRYPSFDSLVAPQNMRIACSAIDDSDYYDFVSWEWSLSQVPAGSTPAITTDESNFAVIVDRAGDYEISLQGTTEEGLPLCETATFDIRSELVDQWQVRLSWTQPDGGDADVDLQVLRPDGCWTDFESVCYYGNRVPDWGPEGFAGNAWLLDDSQSSEEPETVLLLDPVAGEAYKIIAEVFTIEGGNTVDLRLDWYHNGIQAGSITRSGAMEDEIWYAVDGASSEANWAPVDQISLDLPPCI